MKLKKINLIEAPKKEFNLDDDDMSFLLGGDNCQTFTQCGDSGKNICISRDGANCNGNGGMKCGVNYF